jgi:hypothetical protein
MRALNHEESILRQEILARKLATEDQLDGELSIPFMNTCNSKVNRYLSLVRPADVVAAYDKPNRIEEGKKQIQKSKAQQWWSAPTDEDIKARLNDARTVSDEFGKLFPWFCSVHENTGQIVSFLKTNHQIFNLENLINAYQALALEGKIAIVVENYPGAPSDAPAEPVSGRLAQLWIRRIPELLEPYTPKSEAELAKEKIKHLSADEFKAEYLDKPDIPPMIARRIESDIREFCTRHRNYDPSEEGKDILLSWIREQGLRFGHDSLELSWRANQEQLRSAGCVIDEGPSIPVSYGQSTLTDHRKPYIPPVERPITLEPSPQIKRIDMEKLLALPADEFRRVVNGTPGLRELLDGEQS